MKIIKPIPGNAKLVGQIAEAKCCTYVPRCFNIETVEGEAPGAKVICVPAEFLEAQ